MEKVLATTIAEFIALRGKAIVKKSTIPVSAIRNSPFVIKKIEGAKRLFEEHPFPVELLRTR